MASNGLEAFAVERGRGKGAKLFDARDIVIDERVRMKCEIPRCPHYGQCLTCPPNIISVDEFRKTAALYKNALLIQIDKPDREQAGRHHH